MRSSAVSFFLILLLGGPSAASDVRPATEVVFVHGGTMEIKGYRQEGNAVWLILEGGHKLAVHAAQVLEFRNASGQATRLVPPVIEAPVPPPSAPEEGTARSALDRKIDAVAERYGVDAGLIRAVIEVESGWNPRAVSSRGAMGLMQLMPATAKAHGVTDPFDPDQNLEAGAKELSERIDEYSGELSMALAAYNAGGVAVARHDGIPPYPETLGYVQKVLDLYYAGDASGRGHPR